MYEDVSISLSLSTHYCGRLPNGKWLKVAREDAHWAISSIRRDIYLNRLVGHQIEETIYDGRVAFLMDDYGIPDENISVEDLVLLAQEISTIEAPDFLPNSRNYVETLKSNAYRRLDGKCPPLLKWIVSVLRSETGEDLSGKSLVHNDLYSKNVLLSSDGSRTVIDWESAIQASPDVEIATIAKGLVFQRELSSSEVETLKKAVNDYSVFSKATMLAVVSTSSWIFDSIYEKTGSIDASYQEALNFLSKCSKNLLPMRIEIPQI